MHETLGLLAACLSSLLGGSAVVATRWAVTAIEPLTLAALRYGVAALFLMPLAIVAVRRFTSLGQAVAAVALGLLFFAIFPYLFTLSLAHTTAARGSLVLTTLPLLTYALSCATGGESPSPRRAIGIGLAMGGVGLSLSQQLDGGGMTGDLLMLAAAGVGAAYNVFARPLIRVIGPLHFTAFGLAVGGTALVCLDGRLLETASFGMVQWMVVGYLGLAGCALTFVLWSYGLQYASPTLVALSVTLNPVASATTAALALGETVTVQMASGFMLVVMGLVLTSGPLPGKRFR